MSAIAARVACVAEATCGTTIRLGASSSGSSARQRLGVGHVERGAGDLAVAQGVQQRRLVDDRPARGVHQVGVGLHRGQLGRADQPAGLVGERAVQRHHVGLGERQRDRPGRPRSPSRRSPPRRRATAVPIRPGPTTSTVERCRSRPSRRAGSHVSHSPARTSASALGQPAHQGQHQRDREVGGGLGEHAGRVAHRDARARWRPRRPRCPPRPRSWRSRAGRVRRRSARRRPGR